MEPFLESAGGRLRAWSKTSAVAGSVLMTAFAAALLTTICLRFLPDDRVRVLMTMVAMPVKSFSLPEAPSRWATDALAAAGAALPARMDASHGWAHRLTSYPSALCLDGSPGLFYLHEGHGSGKDKFILYFEGGGFCTDDDDCARRAGTYYGGTHDDPLRRKLDHPFLSASRPENPLMWNWNRVFARYCDGAYFSGNRTAPVQHRDHHKSKEVFYKGWHIMTAMVEELSTRHGLASASDVVLSGCSAGAIHLFAHLDALRALLPGSARVSGLADSGFYLDIPMFTSLKRFVVTGQEGSGTLSPDCLRDHPGEEEKCLVGAVAAAYVKTPLFAWQSRYDSDQATCEMTAECAESHSCRNEYGAFLEGEVERRLLPNPALGIFLDSCSRHCAAEALPKDDATGLSPLQAFERWYQEGDRMFGQAPGYPCAKCCEGDRAAKVLVM